MTKELEQKLIEEVERTWNAAVRAAIKKHKGLSVPEMKKAVWSEAINARDAVIRRFMDEHNLDYVRCDNSKFKIEFEVGPRKVVEFERDPATQELVRSVTRTVL